jgi:hypothetical protein
MQMIPRPRVKPAEAFKLLEDNNFEDIDLADGTSIGIEPGQPNTLESVLCFVPNVDWLESYGVHTGGQRWTWVT